MNTWEELFLQWLCIKDTNNTNSQAKQNQVKKISDIEIAKFPDLDFVESKVYQCGNLKNEMKIYQEKTSGMRFVLIPGGKFTMGSDKFYWTKPKFEVTIRPFLIGQYLVTQEEWMSVMETKTNPSLYKEGGRYPIEYISWNNSQKFIEKLREKTGIDKYRLLNESEWEYACRARSTEMYYWYHESKIDKYCWYKKNSHGITHPVGEKLPNAFGLYDMNGNVFEWCADNYHENYDNTPSNGTPNIASSMKKVCRGGAILCSIKLCSSINRFGVRPVTQWGGLGFRVSRSI